MSDKVKEAHDSFIGNGKGDGRTVIDGVVGKTPEKTDMANVVFGLTPDNRTSEEVIMDNLTGDDDDD